MISSSFLPSSLFQNGLLKALVVVIFTAPYDGIGVKKREFIGDVLIRRGNGIVHVVDIGRGGDKAAVDLGRLRAGRALIEAPETAAAVDVDVAVGVEITVQIPDARKVRKVDELSLLL